MKLDRLLAITILLINRRRITAKELADYFEVSVRTIHRDLEAINQAGIPVAAYQGVNGGFGILEGFKINKALLTTDEIFSIATALKGINSTIDDRKISDTLEKIKSLVPPGEIENFKEKSKQVIIDFSPWGTTKAYKENFKVIKNAISQSRVIKFKYRNSEGISSERVVEPVTTVFKGTAWYLYGYCRTKKDYRVFRLSRMKDFEITGEHFNSHELPVDSPPWENNWIRESGMVNLVLRFDPKVSERVYDFFYEDLIIRESDGSLTVRVSYPEDDWVYGTILSYGENVEVLEPQRIRDIIREKARKVFEKYN
ncbi:MAG TPA: YafY family protein [Clostridia bacterium]|nr:YafY family protein [Clostridia bacterium]